MNRVVGHMAAAPLLYPFTQWKLFHDAHHRRTNSTGQTFFDQLVGKMDLTLDTAFVPLTTDGLKKAKEKGGFAWALYVLSRVCAPAAVSLLPLILTLLFPRCERAQERRQCRISLFVWGASALSFAAIIYGLTGSIAAIAHFWILPVLVHALWLGYYAFLQHTGEEIDVFEKEEWNSRAQFLGVVNTKVPRIISLLHSNSDLHVVHHIAPTVPSYHMRDANEALLRSPYAHFVREVPFSLRHFLHTSARCHAWDNASNGYVTFYSSQEKP